MKKLLSLSIALFTLLIARAQNCPGILVQSPSYEVATGDTVVFIAITKNAPSNVTYNWTISAGTIISGQGTSVLKVETKDLDSIFVTATVELSGLPGKCVSRASSSVEIIPSAQLVVSGTFTNGQELKNAVQRFIAASGIKDPENAGTGFIFLYKNTTTTKSALEIFKAAIVSAFEYNKILSHQYKIVEGSNKKLSSYEMYLLQPGGKEPKPSN